MNLNKLKTAEAQFMSRYPGGFQHPDMLAIGKKHKMDKMVQFTQTSFSKSAFDDPDTAIENLTKLVTRSSMVSLFEKPKFRDYVFALSDSEKTLLLNGYKQLFHGKQQQGFEAILDILAPGKLAKWSLITVGPAYFRPTEEVFVKPTTAKGVISQFDLKNLSYNPKPSWDFYIEYRRQINEMKQLVDPGLSPSNAAFSGFLMMSLD